MAENGGALPGWWSGPLKKSEWGDDWGDRFDSEDAYYSALVEGIRATIGPDGPVEQIATRYDWTNSGRIGIDNPIVARGFFVRGLLNNPTYPYIDLATLNAALGTHYAQFAGPEYGSGPWQGDGASSTFDRFAQNLTISFLAYGAGEAALAAGAAGGAGGAGAGSEAGGLAVADSTIAAPEVTDIFGTLSGASGPSIDAAAFAGGGDAVVAAGGAGAATIAADSIPVTGTTGVQSIIPKVVGTLESSVIGRLVSSILSPPAPKQSAPGAPIAASGPNLPPLVPLLALGLGAFMILK